MFTGFFTKLAAGCMLGIVVGIFLSDMIDNREPKYIIKAKSPLLED